MLETIRGYALEKLVEAQEEEQARDIHLDYYIRLAEHADVGVKGRDQVEWLALLNQERDNLRVALSWCVESGKPQKGLQLAANLGHFWWMTGNNLEGLRWFQTFQEAVETTPSLRSSSDTAKAFLYHGLLLSLTGDPTGSKQLDESLSIYQNLGDNAGKGMVMCWQGAFEEDLAKGYQTFQQGLEFCYQAEDPWWIAETYH